MRVAAAAYSLIEASFDAWRAISALALSCSLVGSGVPHFRAAATARRAKMTENFNCILVAEGRSNSSRCRGPRKAIVELMRRKKKTVESLRVIFIPQFTSNFLRPQLPR